MRTFLLSAVACVSVLSTPAFAADPAPAGAVRHRLLLNDESRRQLLYVDEAHPESNWVVQLPWRSRDTQLVGNHRVMVTREDGGIREYDLRTREVARDVTNALFAGIASAQRLPDGRTIVGCNQKGVTFHEVDAEGRVTRTASFPQLNTLRLMRLSPRGTLLFGANTDHLVEADLAGKVLRDVVLPGSKHNYQVVEKPDGHWLAAAGYGAAIVEIGEDGREVRRWGGHPAPAGYQFHFYSQFQLLKNGHVIAATWTGHGANDSEKGQQVVEFAPDGTIVWKWHDPRMAGSIHGVIVLDDLDPAVLNDDRTGVLGPVVRDAPGA
jgi:hypothetical protein